MQSKPPITFCSLLFSSFLSHDRTHPFFSIFMYIEREKSLLQSIPFPPTTIMRKLSAKSNGADTKNMKTLVKTISCPLEKKK
ncbi:hypothetical protein VIGAN_07100900 [Vigna angularis var. angularis]|uniref:Uncharacterized protein n=1 Tax=Vigna angularis var. angularis TaxID=157739 RepID=A0A0S3SHQ9_PHAAN|nr:hypothetical protein VIGAN_07100900 [Vigna angularis var. angularis]